MGEENMERRVIMYSPESPGPTHFFDTVDYRFIDVRRTQDLISSGVAELNHVDRIPHIILIVEVSGEERYWDSTVSAFISREETRAASQRGATLLPQGSDLEAAVRGEHFTERLLIGATAATGTTAVAATAASLPFAMGFTSSGVVAGSAAAAIQSGIGSVAAGSGFAMLQSIAATTLIGTVFPVAVAGAAVVGTVAAGVALHRRRRKRRVRNTRSADR